MSPTSSEYVAREPNLALYKAFSKKTIWTAKTQFHTAQLDHDKSNIRYVWTTVKEILRKNKSNNEFPEYFTFNGAMITDLHDIANHFNEVCDGVGPRLSVVGPRLFVVSRITVPTRFPVI